MLKYTKKDIGLYVALSLVGAGTGLLIGAVVASRLKKRRENQEITPQSSAVRYGEADVYGNIFKEGCFDDVDPDVELTYRHGVEEVEPGQSFDRPKEPLRPIDEPQSDAEAEVVVEYTDLENEPQKALYSQDQIKEFCELYEPTQMQLGMVTAGIISMKDMEMMIDEGRKLLEEYENERTPYSEPYRPRAVTTPKLNEVASDEEFYESVRDELVDDRFLILQEGPEEGGYELTKDFIFTPNPEEPQWVFFSSRGNLVQVSNIQRFVSTTAWEFIAELLLERDGEEVCVQDIGSSAIYRFRYDPEEGESGADSMETDGIG